ncbi:hypothetical protein BU17DRAFT_95061 [Hysterangium stoloniferum]|nr:hypothetical protein BU17DRAFT_95061 [Hysterangium stoloniferum]
MEITTAGTTSSDDPWAQPSPSVVSVSSRIPAQKIPVRESWDDDDDDDDDEHDEHEPQGKDLWNQANSRTPMPHIQISTTTTTTRIPVPPAAALQGPLRILKRPSAASSSSPSPSGGAQAQKSFKEREAQYQAARERIFGEAAAASKETDKDAAGPPAGVKPKTMTATASIAKSTIIRDPLGPSVTTEAELNRGFRGRRRKGDQAVASVSVPSAKGTNNGSGGEMEGATR